MTIHIELEHLPTILAALAHLEEYHRQRQHAALQAGDKETARDHRSEANEAERARIHMEEIRTAKAGSAEVTGALSTLAGIQRGIDGVLQLLAGVPRGLKSPQARAGIEADIKHLEDTRRSIGETTALLKGLYEINLAEEITGQAAPADTPPNDKTTTP